VESTLIEILVTLLLAWLVWRFVARLIRRPPAEAQPSDGSNSLAPIRPRPKLCADAIAVAEPDDDDNSLDALDSPQAISPRQRGGGRDWVA